MLLGSISKDSVIYNKALMKLFCDVIKQLQIKRFNINPLSPNSDKHLIPPYTITTSLNIQDMRIKKVITKDKMS